VSLQIARAIPLERTSLMSYEGSVYDRYARAARTTEVSLCCSTPYAPQLLAALPAEIVERDYGCGDPTPYVQPGDIVLDLGSGTGKICYMLAQLVGRGGRVIGVDCNAEMLAVARRHQAPMAERLGYSNVTFRCGLIQDLKLDLDRLAEQWRGRTMDDPQSWLELRHIEDRLRREQPLVPDASVDCVVSNCVLNLVRPEDREQLFREIFRVLKPGGRAAISDIVADEDVPEHLQRDPALWSGCVSGAHREDRFLEAFRHTGFHGIHVAQWQREPWQTVEGIEFRSVTVLAYKRSTGPNLERHHAVVYRGPFARVVDDDGRVFDRGQRTAVSDQTYALLQREPYAGQFEAIAPRFEIPIGSAAPFDGTRPTRRDPRETKGRDGRTGLRAAQECCSARDACCR
jgi:SAM-dependent methyltransferase